MIIKGASRGGGAQLATYLESKGKNERTQLIEIKGTLSQDIRGAVSEMSVIAAGSRAEKPFYHAQINPKEGERLTAEEAIKAADILADKLKLSDNQRIIVEHEKEGRQHFHVAFNRVNGETQKAVNMGNDRRACHEAAREIEKDLGLEKTASRYLDREAAKKATRDREPEAWQYQQAERKGAKNPREQKAEIAAIYSAAANGQQLRSSLENSGYVLAQGERKGVFLVVNQQGGFCSLARQVDDKAADVRAKLADLDPASLPTLDEAKEQAAHLERKQEPPQMQTSKEELAVIWKREKEQALADRRRQRETETDQKQERQQPAARIEPEKKQQPEQEKTQQQERPRPEQARPRPEPEQKTIEKATRELHTIKKEIDRIDNSGLRVIGGFTNKAGKVLDKVADVADAFIEMFDPPTPRMFTPQELFASKQAQAERKAQLEREKERGAALDRMAESVRKSRAVSASDLRAMNRNDLEALRDKGGDYIMMLIRQREQEQKRERMRER